MKRNKAYVLTHNHSIRANLLVCFIGFTAVGLLALFAFQSLFLEDVYEWLVIRTVRTAANEVASAMLDGNVEESASYWNVKERMSVYIVSQNGTVNFKKTLEGEEKDSLNHTNLKQLFSKAVENGGTYITRDDVHLETRGGAPQYKPDKKPDEQKREKGRNQNAAGENGEEFMKSILYAKIVTDRTNDTARMVLISSFIAPVDATLRTLRVQFFVAASVLVLMAALFSIFVAGKIARPISDLNKAAKRLASDDYRSPPQGGYLEAVELRQTLDETAQALKKTQQLQKELIANLSHDLRTPLTMITGYSEAIRDFPGEDVAENIQVVIDEADRLTNMVNDILDLSRLQAGTQRVEMTEVNLTETLRSIVHRCEQMVQSQGYRMELEAEDTILVTANEVRLTQVIYNLLSNALFHIGDDKLVMVEQIVRGENVRVSVTDHGAGIPTDELENIWLRYYRVRDPSNHPEAARSGLGLNIVYTLVRLHGGTCGVESELGKGSTFWFELPINK